MKKLYSVSVVLSMLLFTTNIFAQSASVMWVLSNTTQLTSVSVGNVTGLAESISAGSGQFGMSVFDYSNDGQRLWEGTAGWISGTEEATRYIQFDALPANENSFSVTNVSFNYGAAGIDHNIQSNAYYSTDGWVTRTLLNANPLAYPSSTMSLFTHDVNVTIGSGTTFSVRIYPYAVVNSSPMRPTFAVHNSVGIRGTTVAKKNCVIQITDVTSKWGKSVVFTAKLFEPGITHNTGLPDQELKLFKIYTGDSGGVEKIYTLIGSGTTDANGIVSIAYTIPQDSVASSLKMPQDSVASTIIAEFAGDANYNAQSGTGLLTVVRHVTSLVVAPTTAVFGQDVVLTATLTDNDENGKGVSNQELKFYKISPGPREGDTTKVYVGSGTTNSSGVASVQYPLGWEDQWSIVSNTVKASFDGDANYSAICGIGTLKKMTAIQITDVAGKWGKSVLLMARLQETSPAGNTNLPGRKVSMGTRESDTCDCPLGDIFNNTGTTDANGIVSIAYTIPQDSASSSLKAPQDSIAHSIKAEFAGDAIYNSISSFGKLTIVRHLTTLSIRGHGGGAGKIYTQDLALTDNDNSGNGIPNQILKFYIDKVYVKSGTTDASGVASISFTLPQDSVSHSITASYAGDVNYSPQSNTGTITYTLKSCIIQMANVASKWGKSIELTARLQEPGLMRNTDLPNQVLRFYKISPGTREGDTARVYINSGTTNASGVASISYTIPQDSVSGSITAPQDSVAYSMRVEFAGDANYSAQNGVGILTVVRHVTSILVPAKRGIAGQSIKLEGTLTDNDNSGKGVSNQLLKFSINGLVVGSGTTDAGGVAIVSYTLPQDSVASTHTITAVYTGDANYSLQSGTGTLTYTLTGIENNQTDIPTKFDLSQNYPNPFNPTSTIKYDIPKTGFVNISVYDILGKEIKVLVNEEKNPGHYEIIFDAREVASGIYFYTIRTAEFTQSKKMILLK